jgi:hypothetical protein
VRIALTLVIGLLRLLALIYFLGPKIVGTSRSIDAYVCARYGMYKHVEKQKLGMIPYRTETKYAEPAISVMLGREDGAHVWLLYVSRPNLNRPFAPNTPGGDRVNYSIQWMAYDHDLPAELARMPNPRDTWTSFVTALSSNAAFEKAFLDWHVIAYGTTNYSFSAWAATNGYWSPPTNQPAALAH